MSQGRGQRASDARNLLFSFLSGPSFLILGLLIPPRLPSGDLVGVVELKDFFLAKTGVPNQCESAQLPVWSE